MEESKNAIMPMQSMQDLVKSSLDFIKYYKILMETESISTGFRDLDFCLRCGLKKGTLSVLLGRPSMGKTAFAFSLLRNVGVINQKSTAFFSFDMDFGVRLLANVSGCNLRKISEGTIDASDEAKIADVAEVLSDSPIYMFGDVRSIDQIEETSRYLKKNRDIQLIILDSFSMLQYSSPLGRKSLPSFCERLKSLAVELDLPIFITGPLSRRFETDMDHQNFPPLPAFRFEVVDYPGICDYVMMLYREEYYEPTDSNRGHADIRFIRCHDGLIDRVRILFNRDDGMRFDDRNPNPQEEI